MQGTLLVINFMWLFLLSCWLSADQISGVSCPKLVTGRKVFYSPLSRQGVDLFTRQYFPDCNLWTTFINLTPAAWLKSRFLGSQSKLPQPKSLPEVLKIWVFSKLSRLFPGKQAFEMRTDIITHEYQNYMYSLCTESLPRWYWGIPRKRSHAQLPLSNWNATWYEYL